MNTDDGGKAAVGGGRGSGVGEQKPVRCPYCEQPDNGWLDADLKRGKRNGGTEYHCYAGYCLD